MITGAIYQASLLFALVLSTGASVYGYLCWTVFRGSPVGHASLLLTFAMVASVVYHALPLVFHYESALVESVEGLLSTALLVMVFLMIWSHRRMEPANRDGNGQPK